MLSYVMFTRLHEAGPQALFIEEIEVEAVNFAKLCHPADDELCSLRFSHCSLLLPPAGILPFLFSNCTLFLFQGHAMIVEAYPK